MEEKGKQAVEVKVEGEKAERKEVFSRHHLKREHIKNLSGKKEDRSPKDSPFSI